ncbi:MAG: sensor histidine kinase [Mucilaginibacter sp.]|nr:sensor histidine kinase [Mucilaginibacter sp.]
MTKLKSDDKYLFMSRDRETIFLLFMLVSGALTRVHGQTSVAKKSPPTIQEQKGDPQIPSIKKMIELANQVTNKPGEEKKDLDTAIGFGQRALALSIAKKDTAMMILSKVALSRSFRESNKAEIGKKFRDEALALSENGKFPAAAAEALINASDYLDVYRDGERALKIKYYIDIVRLLKRSEPRSKKLADALKYSADLQTFDGEPSPATMAMLKEAIAIYQYVHHDQIQDVYCVLSSGYSQLEDARQGLKYGLLAVRTAEKFKDSSMTVVNIFNVLAYAYNTLADNQNTIVSLKKALIYADHNKNLDAWLVLSGNLAICYSNIRQFDKARDYIFKALKKCPPENKKSHAMLTVDLLRINNDAKDYRAGRPQYEFLQRIMKGKEFVGILEENIYPASIHYLIGSQRYPEAEEMVTKFKDYIAVQKVPDTYALSKIENFSFKIDSAKKDYLGAIEHFKRYKSLNDSLNKRNHDKQISVLNVEFESERKDQEIALRGKNIKLLEDQSKLQDKVIRGRTLSRNLFIVGAALLALLLIISYNRYQLKRKANDQLNEQREEINAQNDYLKELLNEREWLLKEIHHRVKNNLQIVISLLNSQSAYLTDPNMLDVLRDSQHRMNSISLIHQKLYQGDDLSGVCMPTYVFELTDFLGASFFDKGRSVFALQIAPVTLDVSQAVPLGLIMNEAVTNAIKYAFNGEKGQIAISLTDLGTGRLRLEIKDDGPGLPDGFDPAMADSLGMNLMRGLADQLDAQFEIRNAGGVLISVEWHQRFLVGNEKPIANLKETIVG